MGNDTEREVLYHGRGSGYELSGYEHANAQLQVVMMQEASPEKSEGLR